MQSHIWGKSETQFFFQLDPSLILDSIDALGFKSTGRCLALNSMENRVYEIEVEAKNDPDKSEFVVAKFYRPGRWSRKQILDEHSFLLELAEDDIPVIAPLKFNGETLFKLKNHELYYTLFKKEGGRIPDEMNDEKLEIIGRLLARIHNVGSRNKSLHRLHINPSTFGTANLELLLSTTFIPTQFKNGLENVVKQIVDLSTPLFEGVETHRIHGDCHRANLIYHEKNGPYFVDFDDMLVGPAVQDIWLIVPGTDEQSIKDRSYLLEHYELMRKFDYRTLKLIEPLRALRFIHFAAWMAKRWDDPAFKTAFPYFGTEQYWSTLITDLHMQIAKVQGNSHYLQ